VDDLTAEVADPLQRRVHVWNGEIRERHPIAGARPSRMEAERGTSPVSLPPFPFTLVAALKLHVQEPVPEPAGPSRVVGGELDESERRSHATTIASPDSAVQLTARPCHRPRELMVRVMPSTA
jgi:hypothetical protein